MTATPKPVPSADALDFEPQLVDEPGSPERSISWIVRWFYRHHIDDQSQADDVADQYLSVIRSLATIPAAEPVGWHWRWKDDPEWLVSADDPRAGATETRLARIAEVHPLGRIAGAVAHQELHVVFDTFPSPIGARFIEVEDDEGNSIDAGEWRKRPDGLAELVIRSALVAPQPARETDDAPGLEAAAKWHDGEADKALDRLQTAVDRKKRLWLADANRMHRKSAAALRARCQP